VPLACSCSFPLPYRTGNTDEKLTLFPKPTLVGCHSFLKPPAPLGRPCRARNPPRPNAARFRAPPNLCNSWTRWNWSYGDSSFYLPSVRTHTYSSPLCSWLAMAFGTPCFFFFIFPKSNRPQWSQSPQFPTLGIFVFPFSYFCVYSLVKLNPYSPVRKSCRLLAWGTLFLLT